MPPGEAAPQAGPSLDRAAERSGQGHLEA
jgi:hypothetical protein